MKKHWPAIKLIMTQWVLFAMLLAVVAMWQLLKDRKELQAKVSTCQQNWANIEKQMGSGRIILELKKGGE